MALYVFIMPAAGRLTLDTDNVTTHRHSPTTASPTPAVVGLARQPHFIF